VSAQTFEPMPEIAAITGIAESAGIEKQAQQLSLRNVSWALGRLGRGWDRLGRHSGTSLGQIGTRLGRIGTKAGGAGRPRDRRNRRNRTESP
jgi:hypothetical protein